MNLSAAVLTHLRDLTSAFDDDGAALGAVLADLLAGLAAAVPSYRGLRLTIHQDDYPIVVTAFTTATPVQTQTADGEVLAGVEGGGVRTSLRVPLVALGPGLVAGGRVIFYAGTPGALVDLAADISYVLDPSRIPTGGPAPSPGPESPGSQVEGCPPPVVLDDDLPPISMMSGLTGVAELSTINRAVGLMIGRGRHPDDAHAALRRHAAAAGVDPRAWAARLLRR